MQQQNDQKTAQGPADKSATANPGALALRFLPIGVFIAISAGLIYFVMSQQAKTEQAVKQSQQQIEGLGLPQDYPLDVVPLYPGVTVIESERTDTESSEGQPMDRWFIQAEFEGNRKPIFEYYHDLLLDLGMSQTLFISVPAADDNGASYAANYADEQMIVELNIEKKIAAELTQLQITVSRLQ